MLILIFFLICWVFYRIYTHPNEWDLYSITGISILSGVGMRTVFITDALNFHAMEIILFIMPLFYRYQRIERGLLLNMLFIFCIFGFVNSFINTRLDLVDSKLGDFKGFMILFPCIVITSVFVSNKRSWSEFGVIYSIAMSFTSLLGIIEYYFPGIASVFTGFYNIQDVDSGIEYAGFRRARFSFWGAPTVGHIMLLGIPIWLSIRNSSRYYELGVIRYLIFPLILWGVIICGARADWIILVLFFIVYYTFFNDTFKSVVTLLKGVAEMILIITFAVINISQEVIDRFLTGLFAIGGKIDETVDSSSKIRKERIDIALETITQNPLGVGWGNSGWVHSDILQLTCAIGWLGGGLFVVFYIYLLYRGIAILRSLPVGSYEKNVFIALVLCHLACGYQFSLNGIYFWTITGIPYFILLGFLYNYIKDYERTVKGAFTVS